MAPPALLLALFFASGFAGLVYELLWVRQLALIFGNTAQSTAVTLAVFFFGLAVGQRAAGRRAMRASHPLRVYAALEALLVATACMYFAVPPLYRALSPALFAWCGTDGVALTAARALLAAAALLPLCTCMGATLPVMGHLLVRRPDALAPTFGVLYAVQTIGGALGAFSAGFWLPAAVGFARTYLLAMALSATIAALAYLTSRAVAGQPLPAPSPLPNHAPRSRPGLDRSRPAMAIACVSGFAALAIEVLWTHMFSQALHNSIYSFAAILVTFLLALSLGGLLARTLARIARHRPLDPLVVLLAGSGLTVALSPFVFAWLTDGLRLYASGEGWAGYVRATFTCAAAVMLLPGILLGSVFPYTLRLAHGSDRDTASVIGGLAFWNTLGAVAGSLAAGFLALPWLGLWSSLRAVALLYVLAAAAIARLAWRPVPALTLALVGSLLFFTWLDPTRLPRLTLAPGEELKTVHDSASGTVAVTEADGVLAVRLDGHYVVGGSGALSSDRRQAELPMLLYPAPRSMFFLGLGTGVTAGAALFHPVERVTVAELVPDIAQAARDYFGPMTNGLFSDPRARIVIGDGRTLLAADPQRYDVIVGDLFVPWQSGTGSLYTREHFANIRARLTDEGIFAQWLPLYQLSMREFAVIAHTMLEVFPLVTVWRGDFSATEPIVALVGHRTERPLDLGAVVDNVRQRTGGEDYPAARARALALLFYAGNLTAARALVAGAPINTDDQPVIEYLAPVTPMEVVRGRAEWLTGFALSRLWAQLAAMVPVDEDPYLALVPAEERQDVDAGRMLYDASVLRAAGEDADARATFAEFARRVPGDVAAAFGVPGGSN